MNPIRHIQKNGGHAKKQWDRVHASEAYEALLHCFPLFFASSSKPCLHALGAILLRLSTIYEYGIYDVWPVKNLSIWMRI